MRVSKAIDLYGSKSKISYIVGNTYLVFANSFNYFKLSNFFFFNYIIEKNKKSLSQASRRESCAWEPLTLALGNSAKLQERIVFIW